MAISFKIAKGKLPEWHWLYKKDSTELVDPFFHYDSLTHQDGVSYTDKYMPEMVVGDGTSYYNNYWKFSDEYKIDGEPGLVYTGTTPGLGNNATGNLFTTGIEISGSTKASGKIQTYTITRPANAAGGYDLVITGPAGSSNSTTYLAQKCPTCLYFELVGGGGGGSALLERSNGDTAPHGGNGGGGGGFVAGILDFSKAPLGFKVYVGAGGAGGTFSAAEAYEDHDDRRSRSIGSHGTTSYIVNIDEVENGTSVYTGVSATGGDRGTAIQWNTSLDYPTWECVTKAPAGGKVGKKRRTGDSIAELDAVPSEVNSLGIHVLYAKEGAAGGVHINAWTTNQAGKPPSTNCSGGTFTFISGHSSKTFSAQSGGTSYATGSELGYAGGGASQIGAGVNSAIVGTPGYGAGGAGGVANEGYRNGQNGGDGYFKLYYGYTPTNMTSGGGSSSGGGLPGGPSGPGFEEGFM